MAGQGDGLAFGAADDGAGQVAACGRLAAAGQDEVLQAGGGRRVMVQVPLQRNRCRPGDGGVAGMHSFSAQVEQLVLQLR